MVINQLRPVVGLGFCLGQVPPGRSWSIYSEAIGGMDALSKVITGIMVTNAQNCWEPLMIYDENFGKGIRIVISGHGSTHAIDYMQTDKPTPIWLVASTHPKHESQLGFDSCWELDETHGFFNKI